MYIEDFFVGVTADELLAHLQSGKVPPFPPEKPLVIMTQEQLAERVEAATADLRQQLEQVTRNRDSILEEKRRVLDEKKALKATIAELEDKLIKITGNRDSILREKRELEGRPAPKVRPVAAKLPVDRFENEQRIYVSAEAIEAGRLSYSREFRAAEEAGKRLVTVYDVTQLPREALDVA